MLELGIWLNCIYCYESLTVMVRLVPVQVPCSVHGFHVEPAPRIVASDGPLALKWAMKHRGEFILLPYRLDLAKRNEAWTLI